MTDQTEFRQARPGRVLSIRSIVIGGVVLVIIACGAAWLLLSFYGGGTTADAAKLDAVRTTATIVLGTGGAAALLLTARRQRAAEQTLEHQREVAAIAERDNIERRISELYTRAAEQLGSEKAPVRMAGLYALERLAQENTSQRQVVVNLVSAYLRMPFTSLQDDAPTPDAPREARDAYAIRRQEADVRGVAQTLLSIHLRESRSHIPDELRHHRGLWPGMVLNLSGAYLSWLYPSRWRLVEAVFDDAVFDCDVSFDEIDFSGGVNFHRTQFNGTTTFEHAKLGMADFSGAVFRGAASFNNCTFGDDVMLAGADFEVPPTLDGAKVIAPSPSSHTSTLTAPQGWRIRWSEVETVWLYEPE